MSVLDHNHWNVLRAARQLAICAHAKQSYPPGGDTCFAVHLGHVVGVLSRFGIDDPLLHAAGWLHDIVEDTAYTIEEVRRCLGALPDVERVLHIVDAVTDAPGVDRAARKANTYPRIAAAGPDAIDVKLADRIANVEAAIGGYHHYLFVYAREHDEFTRQLQVHGGNNEMWAYLNNLLAVKTLLKVGLRDPNQKEG